MTSKRNAQLNTASAFAFTFFQVCDSFAGFYWRWLFWHKTAQVG